MPFGIGYADRHTMASGEELLIADSNEQNRKGLRQLFDSQGYVCTVVEDMATAQSIARRKFFPVALIDLDFGGVSEGLELVHYIRQHSAPSRIVLMTARRSFEAAVEALRVGVVDIVTKQPEQLEQLVNAVQRATDRYRAGDKDSALLREVRGVLDEAFKIILDMCRKIYGSSSSSSNALAMKPTILIVDEDQAFLQQVAGLLSQHPWEVSVEMTGGSGLDKASTFAFQILAVREQLMDLPGHMLMTTAQAQRNTTLGLLYDGVAGKIIRYDAGGKKTAETAFTSAQDLVHSLEQLVDELGTMRAERRYLQSFRSDHGPFLKRFAELKARIDMASD